MCVQISLKKFCLKRFSLQEEVNDILSKIFIRLDVRYQLFCYSCQILMKFNEINFIDVF